MKSGAEEEVKWPADLTPGEAELIALLLEECGEVVQVCGKILRHGIWSYHPETREVNRDLLIKEIGDVLAAVSLLGLPAEKFEKAKRAKLAKVGKYLHYNTVPKS